MKGKKPDQGWPSYEMQLPMTFNINEFARRTERGANKLWMVLLDNEPGIWRFKGICKMENELASVRIFIDIFEPHRNNKYYYSLFVTTPRYQNLTALEVARIIQKELGADKIYHEGKEVLE